MANPFLRRRWVRWTAATLAGLIVVLVGGFTAIGGWDLLAASRPPSTPFDLRTAPPAPDYAQPRAWLAFPGRGGLDRSTPTGMTAIAEAQAPADVFFVPPTTFHGSKVWNAPYDAPDADAPLNPPVALAQASVFNGCCRIYAPHYRQATLAALGTSQPAVALAYRDVAAAFRWYLAHRNGGRPFILASHSQGTGHAIRLLQEEILGRPAQQRMVAAYLIGGYVPASFAELGLPTCDAPRQTGCVLSYNSSQVGRNGATILLTNKRYWWRGAIRTGGTTPAVCVNPLTWRRNGAAPASANAGALPFPRKPFGTVAKPLGALIPGVTGAVCNRQLLDVDVPWSVSGFRDTLSLVFGSYHINDYGLFYASLRRNAGDRVAAWRQAHPDDGSHAEARALAPGGAIAQEAAVR